MNKHLRLAAVVAALAIIAGACATPAASTAPSTGPAVSIAPAASTTISTAPESTSPGSTAPGSTAPGSTAPGSQAPGSQAPVALAGELTIWHSYGSGAGTEADALKQVLDKITAANPDLKLNVLPVKFDDLFKKYELEAASEGGPDLFIAPNDSLGAEVRANLLLDLDQYLVGNPQIEANSDVAKDGSKVDGKYYMVPESLKAVAVFYDKSAIPTFPATTDALLAAVKDGSVKLGINQGIYHNFGFWAGFGGKLMDDSGKCIADQGGVAESMKFLADLKAAGATFYVDYAAFADAFKSKTTNAIIDGPWATGGYRDAKAVGDNLAVAPIPAGPSGPSQPLTGVDGWYINPATKDPQLAVNFALEMVKPANEQVFVDGAGHIPADPAVPISDEVTKGFAAAVSTGFPRPQVKELDGFWGNFGDALNSVIDKGTDPTTAVASACAAMNKANAK